MYAAHRPLFVTAELSQDMKQQDASATSDPPLGDVKGKIRISNVDDVDKQAANITAWYQEYDQISPGRFAGKVAEVWLDQLQFFLESTSHALRQTCVVWPNAFWFGLPHCDSEDGRVNASPLDRNSIAVRPGNTDFELLTPSDFQILGVVVDQPLLLRYAKMTDRPDLIDMLLRGESFPLNPKQKALFWQRLAQILLEAEAQHQTFLNESACNTLVEDLLTSLLDLFNSNTQPVKLRHSNLSYRKIVSGARNFVLSRPDQITSVTNLCEQLHVSRRTLQNAFHGILGICPVHYLKALRLNAVRRSLRDNPSGSTTVQDIASRWGFWHMSQLAADYFSMFSEHPSDTLKHSTNSGLCFRYPSAPEKHPAPHPKTYSR